MDYNNDYLAHYGILGMRWGIRRFQPYSVHPRKGGEGGKEVGDAKKAQKRLAKYVSKNASMHTSTGSIRMPDGTWKTTSSKLLDWDQPKLKKNPEIRKAFEELSAERQKIKDAGKAFEDFAKLDQKQMMKYLDKAANDEYDHSPDWVKKDYTRKDYVEIYEQEQWFVDNPERGPVAQYMKERGRQYKKEEKKMYEAANAYYAKAKEASEKLLGKYGNKKVRRGSITTVKYVVDSTLDRMAYEENPMRKASDVFFEKVYTNYLYDPHRNKKN